MAFHQRGSYGNSRRGAVQTTASSSRKFFPGMSSNTQTQKRQAEAANFSDEELWGEEEIISQNQRKVSSSRPKLLSTPHQSAQPKRLYPMFEKRPPENRRKIFYPDSDMVGNYPSKNVRLSDYGPSTSFRGEGFSKFGNFSSSAIGKQPVKPTFSSQSSAKGKQPTMQASKPLTKFTSPKPFVKWSVDRKEKWVQKMEATAVPPFVLTITVSNLKKWTGPSPGGCVIFEVLGVVEAVAPYNQGAKVFTLRGENSGEIRCIFYEIDRPMPKTEQGKVQRCVGIYRRGQFFQCLNIRPATRMEIESFQAMVAVSNMRVPAVVKFLNEN